MNFKKPVLLLITNFLLCFAHAQSLNWMLGKWEGSGANANRAQFIRTIVIDSVGGENFSGTRTNESKDKSHARIVTALSGHIENEMLYILNGNVLYKKDPPGGQWTDCSACLPQTKVSVKDQRIILTSEISGCQNECNSTTIYARDLCDFDTATQRYLVNRFGGGQDYNPCIKKTPEMIAEEEKRKQQLQDSIDNANNIARQKEQERIKDSIANAQASAKRRQKEIDDSIAIVKKRAQQITDSLNTVAANEKKLQQHIQDSIITANNIAKQKELQRIKDSVSNAQAIAKKRKQEIEDSAAIVKQRQQEITDSLNLVAANEKKLQQHIQDSIVTANNIAKQKELQRIKDSISDAQLIAKRRQQEIDDSIAIVKQRQQQITDSLNTVAANEQKRQQHINDSINTANNIAKQKELQRIKDSISNAQAMIKKRQQQIDDSIATVKKREQQINDSLNIVAANEKKRQKFINDSINTANNIAKQKELQRIKDSISNAQALAKRRQKYIDDSIKVAKKRQQQITDSLNVVAANEKKRQQFIQDSINAANIAKQQQEQNIKDSIARAAIAKKTPPPSKDTARSSTTKAFATRENVLLQSYHIATPDILLELFDNAEVDGDRVSVYHNNEIIVSNKMLTKEPITIKIHADANNRTHEFTMIAENLGTIPPNTALLRITAGNQVYKLSVKTDLQTNAKIDFFYDGN